MKNTLFIALLGLALFACSKKEETASPAVDNFPYDGIWEGTYSGVDSGTVSITILQDGNLSGQGSSLVVSSTFTLSGTVTEAGVVTASSASTGATFSGNLSPNTGAGTWTNGSVSGTWKANKQ